MNSEIIPPDYGQWLESLKVQITASRSRAALAVNSELIQLYHRIGTEILQRQTTHGWGTKIIQRIADDLKAAFPDMKGFSTRNLHYMRFFAEQCPVDPIVQQAAAQFGQQPAAQLPWFHIVTILTKAEPADREWYALQAVTQGWSRLALEQNLKTNLHLRQGNAVSNFSLRLPTPDSALANFTIDTLAELSTALGIKLHVRMLPENERMIFVRGLTVTTKEKEKAKALQAKPPAKKTAKKKAAKKTKSSTKK